MATVGAVVYPTPEYSILKDATVALVYSVYCTSSSPEGSCTYNNPLSITPCFEKMFLYASGDVPLPLFKESSKASHCADVCVKLSPVWISAGLSLGAAAVILAIIAMLRRK